MGCIGHSTGQYKVPLLINNRRAFGGTAIATEHIVKITINKVPVYQHPNYHLPRFSFERNEETDDLGWS